MKSHKTVLKIMLLMAFTVGCASPGMSKKDYYNSLGSVELGMSRSEFVHLYPDAIPRGAKAYAKGSVEVLEVSYEYFSFFPSGNTNRNELTGMEGQPQWFYFYNKKLVQYGNPNDWPTDPDLVMEHRVR